MEEQIELLSDYEKFVLKVFVISAFVAFAYFLRSVLKNFASLFFDLVFIGSVSVTVWFCFYYESFNPEFRVFATRVISKATIILTELWNNSLSQAGSWNENVNFFTEMLRNATRMLKTS